MWVGKQTPQGCITKKITHSQLNSASSCIPVKEFYKPGGTISMTQGNLTGQIIAKGADKYRCWVYTKFAAKNNTVIIAITAYQPCKVSKKQGIMTYYQQVAMLQQDGHQLTPREAFIIDITKWLEEGKKKGELFIVGGDFNEVLKIGLNLLKLCTNKKVLLVDSLASKERDNKSLSLSGHTIIDYVFVSPELLPAIWKQGYNQFDQLLVTDHRGMFIDFDTEMLFGNGDLKLDNEKMRYIQAKDLYMVKEYIDAMYEYLENQKIWQLHSQLIS